MFTVGGGLGHLAGNVFARLGSKPQTVQMITLLTGCDSDLLISVLSRLQWSGLIVMSRDGWRRRPTDIRRAAAIRLGVDGRLKDRAHRYALERELWAWWKAEEAWMCAPRRAHPTRRPGPGQLALVPELGTHIYGVHPRTIEGRMDWAAARAEIQFQRVCRAQPSSSNPTQIREEQLMSILGTTRIA